MNYRHAYHAGNFADVLKHAVLGRVIAYMREKPAAFRVIDTHAGSGRYLLAARRADATGEWKGGIGRLLGPAARPLPELPPVLASFLAPYLAAVRCANLGQPTHAVVGHAPALRSPPTGRLFAVYPGSPAIALYLMRPQDRLVANELHPEELAGLRESVGGDTRAKLMSLDGFVALKALLPPKERRGVVLIDPPFEETGELERVAEGLRQGLRRFATGVFIAWYPIKDLGAIRRFHALLALLARPRGVPRLLCAEILLARPADGAALSGCGLIIANPPYTLEGELGAALGPLGRCLALAGNRAETRLAWIGDSGRSDGRGRKEPSEQKRRVRTSS
jgi:23S rRNA (adenine2030-N6)-methyltransferase